MKAEINKIRKAIDIIESQENTDRKFRQGFKRYEIKLKMELNTKLSVFIDLLGESSE